MSNGKASTKARKPRKKPAAKPVVKVAPEVEAAPEVKAPIAKKKLAKKPVHYITRQWHTMPMYQCATCPWSTLNEDDMIRHTAKHLVGTPRQDVRRTDTGLVTESGNAIIREEIVESDEE